ncbi:hypothetical protein AB0H42_30830 [Nocardia sp. NPDC050799]|uniref:hypothetical protein n=1 Tax=Nocardia sp. NPDC050799 TaxID=3154842 RepID=UPI0033E9EBE5
MVDAIARGLPAFAPVGWRRLEAWFAMTVVCRSAVLLADTDAGPVRCAVPETVWDAVRQHRAVSAESGDGPWWRLLVRLDGEDVETHRDDGAEPFPGEQLFAPEAYLTDLERYPRQRLPVWLAAYLRRGAGPARTPERAAAAVENDRGTGVRAAAVGGELPDLAVLWARWVVLSAAFVAAGLELGPRVGPSVGVFEGAGRSGSTLTLLPHDRAVLSGGVWEAPMLDAVYNFGAEMPNLFAGAPKWVADPVLNPRAATGLLTFCYWWHDGRWHRGESDPVPQCVPAIPAVWTVEAVAGVIGSVAGAGAAGAEELVLAGQDRSVTRAVVERAFGSADRVDLDGALLQFTMAGLEAADGDGNPRAEPEAPAAEDVRDKDATGAEATTRHGAESAGPGEERAAAAAGAAISAETAIGTVRQHIRRHGHDTTGYPLSTLRAERVGMVWVVRAPAPDGDIALDRAVFYVAPDAVVERSTSSVPWAVFAPRVEERFRRRRAGPADSGE